MTTSHTTTNERTTTRIRGRRLAAGLLAVIGGTTLLVGGTDAGAQAKAAAGPTRIAITQSPIAPLTTCTDPSQSLSYTTFSDTSVFRLRIRAASPLCTPLTATAAIYAMPKDGSQWPQTLAETASFTISDAGITTIQFTKDCTPSQFDVVTGATPQVISPLGERHGPLLFPDDKTAYQDPGIACGPATTTTPSSAAPTTTAVPTTVGNTAVTNTTTTTAVVAGVSSVPTTTAKVSVLDTSSSNDPGNSPQSLAVTGVSSQRTGVLGMTLLAAGIALMLTSRRRGVPNARMITSTVSVDPNSPFTTR